MKKITNRGRTAVFGALTLTVILFIALSVLLLKPSLEEKAVKYIINNASNLSAELAKAGYTNATKNPNKTNDLNDLVLQNYMSELRFKNGFESGEFSYGKDVKVRLSLAWNAKPLNLDKNKNSLSVNVKVGELIAKYNVDFTKCSNVEVGAEIEKLIPLEKLREYLKRSYTLQQSLNELYLYKSQGIEAKPKYIPPLSQSLSTSSGVSLTQPSSSAPQGEYLPENLDDIENEFIKALAKDIKSSSLIAENNFIYDVDKTKLLASEFVIKNEYTFKLSKTTYADGALIIVGEKQVIPCYFLVLKIRNSFYSYCIKDLNTDEIEINAADITGDGYDEIVIHTQLPINGISCYSTVVANMADEQLQYVFNQNLEKFDNRYVDKDTKQKITENLNLTVTSNKEMILYNEATKQTLMLDAEKMELFDEKGRFISENTYTLDKPFKPILSKQNNFSRFEPIDIYGDGTYEILAAYDIFMEAQFPFYIGTEHLLLDYIDGDLQIVKSAFWDSFENPLTEEEFAHSWYK